MENQELTNKYDNNNPYYKSEDSFITKLSEKEKEINDRRIKAMENPSKEYSASIDGPGIMIENEDIIMDDMESIPHESGTVLVEKSFLEKLKNFDYWKEWKNNGI